MYRIKLSDEAEKDFDESYIISRQYTMPLLLLSSIMPNFRIVLIVFFPERHPLQTLSFFQRFGSYARRINYKKMAIIYSIHGDIVYIHRIMPAKLITNL